MDLLKDILNTSGLKKRLLHQQRLSQPWALAFPCPQSMGFHVITQGQAYLWREGQTEPERLQQGDIAFMARGAQHHISTHNDPQLLQEAEAIYDFSPQTQPERETNLVSWVSGAYQLWHDPIHPLFQELPAWYILRQHKRPYADAIDKCLTVLASELQQPALASEAIVDALLDVLFHLVLRQIVSQQASTQAWAAASQDPLISEALRLMHQDPRANWTVASLADAVHLSRAGFAQKFKLALGRPPLYYLTTLRMAKAMDFLANSDQSLTAIANAVGYQDAFGFSKSFKKKVGLSPSAFRQKNAAERELSWRFS